MLQLLYILAFTILALIAVSNLIRNLLMFGFEGDRKGQTLPNIHTSHINLYHIQNY